MTRIVALAAGALALIVLLFSSMSLFETLDASEQMVIQYPDGKLETYATPGIKPQWWGRVTKYQKRANFDFLAPKEGTKEEDRSIPIRFNDAGSGRISGTLAYELPVDKATFLRLHSLYGSQTAVEQKLVEPAVTKAIYMTGPLMSSKESYADRRPEILSLIDDQIDNGVYRTKSFQRKEADPITGQEKTVTVVEIVNDAAGHALRQDVSPLAEFGIKTFNLAINRIPYSPEVEAQIKAQQEMTMAVQTSMMEAKRAEQQRITTEQNGMAEAAKAKWAQEVEKATAVTAAEKEKAVAALDVQTAGLEKQAQILRAEGAAAEKRLIMQADGALEKKIEAITLINARYAQAIQGYAGNWVPTITMGDGGGARAGGSALDLINLLTAKTARDLSLDLTVQRQPK